MSCSTHLDDLHAADATPADERALDGAFAASVGAAASAAMMRHDGGNA